MASNTNDQMQEMIDKISQDMYAGSGIAPPDPRVHIPQREAIELQIKQMQAAVNAHPDNAAYRNVSIGQLAQQAGQGYAGQYGHQLSQQAYQPPGPPPAPPTENELHRTAVLQMNALARHKYEGLFKILEIKIVHLSKSFGGSVWRMSKKTSHGIATQEWSAPSKDPACSLRMWDAMVAELMDEVTRREGIDVTTDSEINGDYGTPGARNKETGSPGDT